MKQRIASRMFGFSLIELMVTIAIIAIIAAVAVPSYQESVRKSKRQIAKGELLELLSIQEQYFINSKSYATDLTLLGFGANPYFIDDNGGETVAANSVYSIALVGASATAYTITAIPQNGQASDTLCGTLQITYTGVKSISGGSGDSATCW